MRVGILEDDEKFLSRTRTLLKSEISGCEIYTWGSGKEIRADKSIVGTLDLLLVDLYLPDTYGIDVIGEISAEFDNLDCIVLTSQEDSNSVFKAIEKGAVGYVVKSDLSSLPQSLKEISEGKGFITSMLAFKILRELKKNQRNKNTVKEASLSERENQVLNEIAAGASTADAANSLGITAETVRSHVKRIYKKLGVRSRVQLLGKINTNKSDKILTH